MGHELAFYAPLRKTGHLTQLLTICAKGALLKQWRDGDLLQFHSRT